MSKVRALINHWERLQEPVRQQLAGSVKAQLLPERLQKTIALMSRADLSDVRVHYNSRLPQAIEARAYTQGNDIFLAPGQERHLPHEAWHVVQQRQGRVRAPSTGGTSQLGQRMHALMDTLPDAALDAAAPAPGYVAPPYRG